MAASLLANINRDVKTKPKAYKADDFIIWKTKEPQADQEPVLLSDPAAQANLLKAVLFGKSSK